MHKTTTADIAAARAQLERALAAAYREPLDTPQWRQHVRRAANIDGWLSVATKYGETRATLAKVLA